MHTYFIMIFYHPQKLDSLRSGTMSWLFSFYSKLLNITWNAGVIQYIFICSFSFQSLGKHRTSLLFLKNIFYLLIFRERGMERGREGEKHQCINVWLPLTHPHQGPGLQSRHVPWLRIEPATLWFAGWCSIHWATLARTDLLFLLCNSPSNKWRYLHLKFFFWANMIIYINRFSWKKVVSGFWPYTGYIWLLIALDGQ